MRTLAKKASYSFSIVSVSGGGGCVHPLRDLLTRTWSDLQLQATPAGRLPTTRLVTPTSPDSLAAGSLRTVCQARGGRFRWWGL